MPWKSAAVFIVQSEERVGWFEKTIDLTSAEHNAIN